MRRIVFGSLAQRDMWAIWEYIAQDNIPAADRLSDRIQDAVKLLADMPGAGHGRRDVDDERYRFWMVKPYVIAYRYTTRTLTVVRVVHGARDFRRIFKRRSGS